MIEIVGYAPRHTACRISHATVPLPFRGERIHLCTAVPRGPSRPAPAPGSSISSWCRDARLSCAERPEPDGRGPPMGVHMHTLVATATTSPTAARHGWAQHHHICLPNRAHRPETHGLWAEGGVTKTVVGQTQAILVCPQPPAARYAAIALILARPGRRGRR